MIYLDNGATSFPKPEEVYVEMDKCMRNYCANPGRGGHSLSITSGRAVLEAREKICNFFNIKDPMTLCFTKNATEALNVAIKGVLKTGDHVITTSMEHNSVIRPLKTIERDIGIEISIVKGNEYGEIDIDDIKKLIKSNTKMIASTLSSNVNGMVMPVLEIGKIARDNGILFLLDASQGAGTIEVDVEKLKIDLMAFPGHKSLMGPQGTGGLYVREGVAIKTIIEGGTGSHSESIYQPTMMPDFLESGTLNTPGIIGLGKGIEFINSIGIDKIRSSKHELVKTLHEEIDEIKNIKTYSKNEIEKNSGIVAFNFNDVDSTEVSYALDKIYNIATRAGLHCAPLAHETLGTIRSGVVRISVGYFNTMDEIEATLNALREISSNV